ncbi:hydroxymethylbilane synthase [Leucobacter weissii]|uniref:Porphobilinogen deaminase n=1 Tax=Leucobacter weissii TaxID=1983706 RepID=A0A939MS83_9MICO|nr:hydroxymethylbilane synthase [Leucobacter weissii]MBO1902059.1 hydroxymethylbilane synthase [Leucobacter weissii]
MTESQTNGPRGVADGAAIPVIREPVPSRPGLIRVGTRGSSLAVTQSGDVAREIARRSGLEVVLVVVRTYGDVSREPLAQLGGTGVFVSALRDALIGGDCDLAVHSLKDLPTAPFPGIDLAAIPRRVDARDALCARDGLDLAGLPEGARVGTGSPRRAAQLRALRPDLRIEGLRGNVDTRLARVGADLDAVVLAAAGLERLGRAEAITERFPLERMPTAPGQGALAVESRAEARGTGGSASGDGSRPMADALRRIDHMESRACALAERALLNRLEAGCAAPVGAWARVDGPRLTLTGTVYRPDGGDTLSLTRERPSARGDAAALLGEDVALGLLDRGAADLAGLGAAR